LVVDLVQSELKNAAQLLGFLRGLVEHHPGRAPLEIVVKNGDDVVALQCAEQHCVSPSAALSAELESIDGVALLMAAEPAEIAA